MPHGTFPPTEGEDTPHGEELIPDPRGSLTPAQMVELKLLAQLNTVARIARAPVLASTRGRTARLH